MNTEESEWIPSSPEEILISPPATVISPVVWIPSPAAVMSSEPDSIYRYPFSTSFAVKSPSSPAVTVIAASLIRILSFAWIASSAAVIVIFPPVMTRSSLADTPCLYCAVTSRLPLPFIVRSSWAKIAPSVPSLSAVSEYSAPLLRIFWLSCASVRKTLSA